MRFYSLVIIIVQNSADFHLTLVLNTEMQNIINIHTF